jgi:hypothetical protein
MKLRISAPQLAVCAMVLLVGCACPPPAPQPPSEPGVVYFVVRGTKASVSFFHTNFMIESDTPHDCKDVSVPPKDGGSEPKDASKLYRCEKTDDSTFSGFGRLFNKTVANSRAISQASLEPVSVAQAGANPLSMVATTTQCNYTYCSWLHSSGPWMPNKVCTQFCN